MQSYDRLIATTEDQSAYFVMEDECIDGYDKCKNSPKRSVNLSTQKDTVSVSDYTGANRIQT